MDGLLPENPATPAECANDTATRTIATRQNPGTATTGQTHLMLSLTPGIQ